MVRIDTLGPLYPPVKEFILSSSEHSYRAYTSMSFIIFNRNDKISSVKSRDQWVDYFELIDRYRNAMSNLPVKLNELCDIEVIHDYFKDEKNKFHLLGNGNLYCNKLEFIRRGEKFIIEWYGEVDSDYITKYHLTWDEIELWIGGEFRRPYTPLKTLSNV